MKNLIKILVTLTLLCSIGQSNAQESNYVRQPGYWTLGINGGLAYQSSDVKTTLNGWGVGATLAKNLYYRPGSAFAFDLRGRLLYDQSYGQDHFRSFGIDNNPALQNYRIENGGDGYAFLNNKTHHGELGLEGVLSFNRLREKTNINLSLFGGIGLDYYATLTDQKNSAGQIYDYSSINPDGRRQPNKAELSNLQDGKYETKAEGFGNSGQLGFMPDLGIELGYQLTPRFSIGLGHKLTFTRTDLFDGNQWNEGNRVTGDNDLHHYTNLHLRWIIDPAKKNELQPPVIEFMTPIASPHNTRDPLAIIKARVKHVSSAMDINYTVNGRQASFNFNREILTDNFYLRAGRNVVQITATNSAGTDQEEMLIYLMEDDVVINPPPPPTTDVRNPRVNFTNPSRSTEYVTSDRYQVTATVLNVERKRDIEFLVNGRAVSTFDFDPRNDRFTSNIRLPQGENRIQITVSNQSGRTATDDATIVLERTQIVEDVPVVNITRPSNDPHRTDVNSYRVEADVYNVNDKIDISFTVNGNRVRSFTFNNNKLSGTVNLRKGNNTVKITGKNNKGQDSDQVVIIFEDEEEVIDPPTVKITSISQPTIDPFNPDQCKVSVKATIKNVDSKNDITFYFDGQSSTSFNYNTSSDEFSAVLTLNTGTHNIRIKATNEAGTDEDSDAINSCSGTPTGGDAPEVTITAPTDPNTERSTVALKATVKNVDSKNDITVKVNGRQVNRFEFDSRRKTVSANITLKEGNNNIEVTGKNDYGTDSDDVNILYRKIITSAPTPPVVTISSPFNNTNTSVDNVDLTGKVEHVFEKKDVSVLLNGRKVRSFEFASRGGLLTATINGLKEGRNTITVKGSNKDGRDEASIYVTYKAAVAPPKVTITSPRDGTKTEQSSTTVKATISGVSSKKDVTLKVNGKTISNFSFSRNTLTATISLRIGANDIYVEGRNQAGRADDEVRVVYTQPMLPPKVKITSPKSGTTTGKSTIAIEATLAQVSSNQDITLKVNGEAVKQFSFKQNKLTANVTLKAGKNTISVEGRNKSGKDSDQVRVTYKEAIPAPVVNITSPRSGMTTDKSTVSLKATLKNVASNKDITLTVNGRTVSKFSYGRGKLSATINLKAGENTIEIEGRNSAGKDTDKTTVTLKQSTPPAINNFALSQPTIDPFNPGVAKSSATATLSNITSKSQIKVYINGRQTSDFEFNTSSKKLTKVFNLKSGNNTVKIIAENADGRKEETKSIQF